MIITRFAPSPTGVLHIGSARTALFNYLYARHIGGKFLLRIEDTDKLRSTEESKQALLDGIEWLGLKHDGKVYYQSEHEKRHYEVALELVKRGKAYYCYTSAEELASLREKAVEKKEGFTYKSPWRNPDCGAPPEGVKPVIRLKVPEDGEVRIEDRVQGEVIVKNSEQDDLILVRSDGTPTYMLAVVVDDHDMGVNLILRGDDHLTNTFKQVLIYQGMDWDIPEFCHIPLIHGEEGGKLSKRHGATGLEEFIEEGYLQEALVNYLVRLGFSHGNDEIFTVAQAIEWFDLDHINKSPARIDYKKMASLNAHYMRLKTGKELIELTRKKLPEKFDEAKLAAFYDLTKERVNLLSELVDSVRFYLSEELEISDEALSAYKAADLAVFEKSLAAIANEDDWSFDNIKIMFDNFAKENNVKLKDFLPIYRILLTGQMSSPSVFHMMEIFGKNEAMKRLQKRI